MKAYKSAAISGGKMVHIGTNSAPPVSHPPSVSLPVQSNILDVSATVGATLDCNGLSTVWSIEYGATTAYGSTQAGGTTSVNGAKTVELSGLTPDVLLHWRFKAVNADGTAYSDDQSFTPTIPVANLVQRLFKDSQPISQNLGTKAIDYSAAPVNANILQPCIYTTSTYQFNFDSAISIDWTIDGVKAEFVASLKAGQTTADIIMKSTANHGIRVYNTMFRIYGFKADGTTVQDIQFLSITTVANDVLWRFRVRKSGVNIIVEKTTPDDVNFANVIQTQTKDASTYSLSSQTFNYIKPNGYLCYLNISGYKWAFGEGSLSRYCYSFNSAKRISLNSILTEMSGLQNSYCHNALYGYSRGYVDYSTYKEYVNIPYQEDGTPATSFHSAFWTRSVFEEFPASKSFGLGYGIKLDASMEAYDQALTFFDASHAAKVIYKNTMPSKLNSRLFFDHANGNELLVYSADKTLTRAINTANKSALFVGDSMFSDSYWWPVILSQMTGLIRTTKSFSGRTLSINVETDLRAQVAITPTLVSDKNFILLGGFFNDWTQNIDEATIISGTNSLLAYLRAQNANAPIFICEPYNWGNPIDDGTTANTAGITRDELRTIIAGIVSGKSNCYLVDWSQSGIVQADLEAAGLHITSIVGGYKLAKTTYDKILSVSS